MKPYSHRGKDKGVKIGGTLGAIIIVVAYLFALFSGYDVPGKSFYRGYSLLLHYVVGMALLLVITGFGIGALIGGVLGAIHDWYRDRQMGQERE